MGRGEGQVAALAGVVRGSDQTPVLRDWFAQMDKLFEGRDFSHLAYRNIEDLVAKLGQSFRPRAWRSYRGRGYRRGRVKLCFQNSFNLAMSFADLTYTEGIAYSGFIPVHHAWCVTPQGEVVDPTWREEQFTQLAHEQWEYLGVPFERDFVLETAGRRRIYGILDEPQLYKDGLPAGAIASL